MIYPTEDNLKSWIKFLNDPQTKLHEYLPNIDNTWYKHVLSPIELVQLPYFKDDLCTKGANIFYKITKNHNLIDGNKRSAVIVTYLFFLLNRSTFNMSPEDLKNIAKETAENNIFGIKTENPEKCVEILTKIFEKTIIYID